ncbi:S8 family serine peptidase [Streptomyces cylindrosporus]|uniref:S8 family serine peptidase n=1 Tax=Streptomyces cylindrosporus TaxID=2927583 RepID=A0ABS9YMV1_9ACTN|nr:S8 family serine peptidase [Streptomyces cylindrosporus]MCI3277885.1 S8 family serine peptidase [Streptomyces cylindrosporus]
MGFKQVLSTTGVVALTGAVLLTSAPIAAADQVRDAQWPLTAYDAAKVWKTSQGAGVTVAVVDSGVDASLPDLTGQVLPGKDFTGQGSPHQDDNGHGTGMASLIAGHGHGADGSAGVKGLAPKAKILPVRVSSGKSDKYIDDWGAGVRYAVDQGASVINLSFNDSSAYPGSKAAEAIAYAQEKGAVVVSGTGNDAGTVNYPAALPGVVAVSAVDQDLNFWSKSNTGNVTVAAPGVRTPQADPTSSSGYVVADGTSGSTAYISAIVALLRSKYPDLTAGQIINRLVKSASFVNYKDKKAPDKELGYGIARPGTALTMDIPKGPKEGPLAQASPSTSTNSGTASGDNESTSAAKEKSDSSSGSTLLIVGIAAAVIVIGIVFAVIRSRRNGSGNGGPGPGGGTPSHGAGYPPQPPTSYQQYPNTPPNPGGYPTPPGQPPQHHNPYAQ